MSKKPHKDHKVEEPQAAYASAPAPARDQAKKDSGVRYIDAAEARRLTEKILAERKSLLHRLAQ